MGANVLQNICSENSEQVIIKVSVVKFILSLIPSTYSSEHL